MVSGLKGLGRRRREVRGPALQGEAHGRTGAPAGTGYASLNETGGGEGESGRVPQERCTREVHGSAELRVQGLTTQMVVRVGEGGYPRRNRWW
jgi:hypothetical protein